MKTRELKELTTEKLNDRLAKLRKEIVEVEFDIKLGQEKDTSSRSKKRREIARILTILNETKGEVVEDKKVEEKKSKEEESKDTKEEKKETKSKTKKDKK